MQEQVLQTCSNCTKFIFGNSFYCCTPHLIKCNLCKDFICNICDAPATHKIQPPNNDPNAVIHNKCFQCLRSFGKQANSKFIHNICPQLYCATCIINYYGGCNILKKKQENVKLSCSCIVDSELLMDYLKHTCRHCMSFLINTEIQLEDETSLCMKCHEKASFGEGGEYEYLLKLFKRCVLCQNIVDNLTRLIGSEIDGMIICANCFNHSIHQETNYKEENSKIRSQTEIIERKQEKEPNVIKKKKIKYHQSQKSKEQQKFIIGFLEPEPVRNINQKHCYECGIRFNSLTSKTLDVMEHRKFCSKTCQDNLNNKSFHNRQKVYYPERKSQVNALVLAKQEEPPNKFGYQSVRISKLEDNFMNSLNKVSSDKQIPSKQQHYNLDQEFENMEISVVMCEYCLKNISIEKIQLHVSRCIDKTKKCSECETIFTEATHQEHLLNCKEKQNPLKKCHTCEEEMSCSQENKKEDQQFCLKCWNVYEKVISRIQKNKRIVEIQKVYKNLNMKLDAPENLNRTTSNYSLQQCKICMDRDSDMINIECRHLMMCEKCFKQIILKQEKKISEAMACPLCLRLGLYQIYILPIYL